MFRRWCLLCSWSLLSVGATQATAQTTQTQPGYPATGYQGYTQQPQAYPQQLQPQQPYPQQQPVYQQPQQTAPGYYPQADQIQQYGYPPGYEQQAYAPNPAVPAAPPVALVSSVKNAIQLGAGIALWQYSSLSLSPSASSTASAAAATAPGPTVAANCCGAQPPFLVEGGYGLTEQLLLGAQLQLGGASESVGAMTAPAREFTFSIGPKVDYHFAPASRWNPFIGAVLNLALTSKSYFNVKDSRTLFGILARAGMRYFLLDQLSIDPTLAIGARFGSGSQNAAVNPGNQLDYSVSGIQFALSVGLSLWLK